MSEEEKQPTAYIFSLYSEHNDAILELAGARCRGNRSEAVRRMIEFSVANMFPALGLKPRANGFVPTVDRESAAVAAAGVDCDNGSDED